MNKWYVSSSGQGVSLTLKGAVLALVPVLIMGLNAFGVDLTEVEVVELVEQVSIAVSAAMVVVGLARKVWVKLNK